MPKPIVLANYSNLVLSGWASELISHITVSELHTYELVSLLLSALVGRIVDFSGNPIGADDVSLRGVPPLLPVSVHRFVQSVGVSGLCPSAQLIL